MNATNPLGTASFHSPAPRAKLPHSRGRERGLQSQTITCPLNRDSSNQPLTDRVAEYSDLRLTTVDGQTIRMRVASETDSIRVAVRAANQTDSIRIRADTLQGPVRGSLVAVALADIVTVEAPGPRDPERFVLSVIGLTVAVVLILSDLTIAL